VKKELVIKADEIVSKRDVVDAGFGKIVMALGIGALFSEKLRKVAKYLVIGGALIQVPVTLRITQKAVKFAKQVKQMKEEKAAEAKQEQPDQDAPAEVEQPTEEGPEPAVEPDLAPAGEPVEKTADLDHLNHPLEPSSHPHEDPNS